MPGKSRLVARLRGPHGFHTEVLSLDRPGWLNLLSDFGEKSFLLTLIIAFAQARKGVRGH